MHCEKFEDIFSRFDTVLHKRDEQTEGRTDWILLYSSIHNAHVIIYHAVKWISPSLPWHVVFRYNYNNELITRKTSSLRLHYF